MQKFLVERNMKGFGDLPQEKLQQVADKVHSALKSFGGPIHWHESFVAKDKIFTILIASDEATVREYSKAVDMPVDSVHPITQVIDPSTGA